MTFEIKEAKSNQFDNLDKLSYLQNYGRYVL